MGLEEIKINALVKKLYRNRKYLRYSRADLYKIASQQVESADKKRVVLKDKLRKRKKPVKRRRSLVRRKKTPKTRKQIEKEGMKKLRRNLPIKKKASIGRKKKLIAKKKIVRTKRSKPRKVLKQRR